MNLNWRFVNNVPQWIEMLWGNSVTGYRHCASRVTILQIL